MYTGAERMDSSRIAVFWKQIWDQLLLNIIGACHWVIPDQGNDPWMSMRLLHRTVQVLPVFCCTRIGAKRYYCFAIPIRFSSFRPAFFSKISKMAPSWCRDILYLSVFLNSLSSFRLPSSTLWRARIIAWREPCLRSNMPYVAEFTSIWNQIRPVLLIFTSCVFLCIPRRIVFGQELIIWAIETRMTLSCHAELNETTKGYTGVKMRSACCLSFTRGTCRTGTIPHRSIHLFMVISQSYTWNAASKSSILFVDPTRRLSCRRAAEPPASCTFWLFKGK